MTSTAIDQLLSTSLDVHQTQTTAPVLEYLCMYTADIRRKQQKRWQDGRLKFHTFNKRVMVYDERSNFVGDTHWRKDYEFDDGEEVKLERGGILVQVGECVGKRDQDLFELVDKRVKEREDRLAARIGSSPLRPLGSNVRPQGIVSSFAVDGATPFPAFHLRQKTLNALIGNPSGHYGRAVLPTISPFEERQRVINGGRDENEHGRMAKRRKQNGSPPSKNSYARNLTGAKLTLGSAKPPSTATIHYEPFHVRSAAQISPAATIDLTDQDDKIEGDVDGNRSGLLDGRHSAEGSSKAHKRKPQISLTTRNCYASNLPAVALTLGATDSRLSKMANISVHAANKPLAQSTEQNAICSSPSDEEDSFVDIDASGKLPLLNVARFKDGAKMRSKPAGVLSVSASRASSPLRMASVKGMTMDESVDWRKAAQKSCAARPNAEHPVSALRIKSRPPRQMMMLMQRSRSRCSAPVEPPDTSSVRHRWQEHKPSSKDIVHSQATLQLNSFCQKQERRLQERLNAKQSVLCAEQGELSSSPIDTGINSQAISHLSSSSRGSTDGRAAPTSGSGQKSSPKVDQRFDMTSAHVEQSQCLTEKRPGETVVSLPTPVSMHVNETFSAATDHFRAIIKSSRCSIIAENSSDAHEAKEEPPVLQVPQESREGVQDFEGVGTSPREITVKQSPKCSPLAQVFDDEFSGYGSANSMDFHADSSHIKNQGYRKAPMESSHSRLVNPATRGKSLQTIAKETIDAVAPAFDDTHTSSLPIVSAQLGRVIGNDDTANASLPWRKAPLTGPWSREAFDLFGSWRTPSRDPGKVVHNR